MTDTTKTIDPNLASGFKDYLPADMIPRQFMFDTVRNVFENFGFVPLDTPGLEKEDVLTGGDPDSSKKIYRAGLPAGGEKMALRFDLTVPLARFIAGNPDLKKPFKRYQTGKVWRGEKPQAGRYREFVQFDVDIVGSTSMLADAEIIAIMNATMPALGIKNFLVRVNNRKILNGLAEYAGFLPDKNEAVLRTIDKLDKQGWDKVEAELCNDAINPEDTIGLTPDQANAIKKFIDLRAGTPTETLDAVEKLMSKSPVALEGISELREIATAVKAMGVPDEKWKVDLSVARGLGYYTGPVFETVLTDILEIGSVFSGGRYNGLIARYGAPSTPATGASLGVDRLFAALTKLGLVKQSESVSKVVVLCLGEAVQNSCLEIVSDIRKSGVPAEIFFDATKSIRDQLGYTSGKAIPLAVIIGSDEATRKVAKLKDMRNGKQEEIAISELVSRIKELI
jgi:histidyl-tRNA synthetase